MHCHIEYMADVLTVGDLEERVSLVDELMKSGKITFLKEHTARKKKEVVSKVNFFTSKEGVGVIES